jgi:hypothetical protein
MVVLVSMLGKSRTEEAWQATRPMVPINAKHELKTKQKLLCALQLNLN